MHSFNSGSKKHKTSSREKRRKIERQLKKGKSNTSLKPFNLLYNIKYKLNESQSNTLLKEIPEDFILYFDGNPLPKKYSEIRACGQTYVEDQIEKEIIWYFKCIIKYSDQINDFLLLENQFNKKFLNGDFSAAENILNEIDSKICVSQWAIEKKLLLAEYQYGFKKNKETLTNIVEDSNHQIINVLARYQSTRIERNLSHQNYEEILFEYLDLHHDIKIQEYLLFKLNFFYKTSYDFLGFILSYDSNSSIIDRYQIFISIILLLLCDEETNPSLCKSIINIIENIYPKINDIRLVNILITNNKYFSPQLSYENKEFMELLDNYTQCEYNNCVQNGFEFLQCNPDYFDAYEIVIKAIIRSNTNFTNPFSPESLAGKTFVNIYNILLKNNSTQEAFEHSKKIYSSLGESSFSYKYYSFIRKENSSQGTSLKYEEYSALNSNYLNPSLSLFFKNKDDAAKFLNDLFMIQQKSSTINLWLKVNELLRDHNPHFEKNSFREQLYQAKVRQTLKKFPEALNDYSCILDNVKFKTELSYFYNYEVVRYGQIVCLLEIENNVEALDLITDIVIQNPNVINLLHFKHLIEIVLNSDDPLIQANISNPILLHMYQQNVNDIWIAYDNFLSHHNIDYPHDFIKIIDNFPKEKTIYFLKNICKPEVYDSSYIFENQDELDNERIEICLLLTQVDQLNGPEYIDEISEISRIQLIRKGIKQIDESKIYADIIGMKKALQKELRERFNRSLELMAIPLEQISKVSIESTGNVVVPYYGKSKESQKVEIKEENIKITSYTRYELFADMFYKIRDKFVSSNEYGIETYLSMRIRHGTLLGEIRSVFENHLLITKQDSNTALYQENKHWLNKLTFSSSEKRIAFNKLLSDFSTQIDKISEELKGKKLQINTEKKPSEGIFDYSYQDNDLLALFRDKIGGLDEYDEFIESVIDEMWVRTEENLSNVRNHILEIIKPEVTKLLTNLNIEIELIINRNENQEVNEIIRNITECQTASVLEFEKIAQWFNRTNNKTINEFNIDLPLEASLATIKRIYPRYSNLKPRVIANCAIRFDGEFFTQFSDLMQILIHNIIKHSQLDPSDLLCDFVIDETDSRIICDFSNNVSNNVNLISQNQSINDTITLLNQEHESEALRKEEKSGFLKIRKILKSGLNREQFKIDINPINKDRIFRTVISFETNNLQKIYKDEAVIN